MPEEHIHSDPSGGDGKQGHDLDVRTPLQLVGMNPQKERLCFRGSNLVGIDYRWTTSLALASRASLESDASTTSTTAPQSHAQMEELAQVSWEF